MSAVEIEVSSVHPQSYFIQVGAFKKMPNIEKVKDKLFEYEIYLEPYKSMYRVHVVNIPAPYIKETLAKIRKIYPKAFIAKRPNINSPKAHRMKQPSPSFKKSSEPSSYKLHDTQFLNPTLDSNTILKTRKSFL